MAQFDEANTTQAAIVERLSQADLGWTFIPGDELPRTAESVFVVDHLVEALLRLNPILAEDPDRMNELLPKLRAVLFAVGDDGLLATNERMVSWLRGTETHRFVGTENPVPIRLLEFDDPRSNRLVVSTEVTYGAGDTCRYDIVLFVNGIPLVVGETKTPIKELVSWLDAANDVHAAYEQRTPGFFVPNVLSFASEGKEFRCGAVGQPSEFWLPWARTTDEVLLPGMASVLRSTELLLSPDELLDVLRNFTLFQRSGSGGTQLRKIIPRYPQVEAVNAIVARVLEPGRNQGLIWHHQGSGKTLLMAFAAAKLRRQLQLDAPTILVVLDRLDLIEQVVAEFASAGVPTLKTADTRDDLRRLLATDVRGVIVTTIFRFAEAGMLNDRRNIVVMVDEAHRTQEGRLGLDMREALPNAKFIGLTGTPVSAKDRNTFATFGDPDDPDGVLNHYTVERSIADGATLPIHVETRLVDFHIGSEELDSAFDELAEREGLEDEDKAALSGKAARIQAVLSSEQRVKAVCADIVEHYNAKVAPLGLKAQIVVFDRALCVRFHDELVRQLAGTGLQSTVVMTTRKDDPAAWRAFDRDRSAEQTIKDRFNDPTDPLTFLIVTAKLLTGFDAPIEGVMYLDKPLRAHTLFQAVCRTNRRYTNPAGQEKLHGLIVDYVGIGNELARALNIKDTGVGRHLPTDVEVLFDELGTAVEKTLQRFSDIDRTKKGFEGLMDAQQQLITQDDRDAFATDFLRCQGLFEFLYPDLRLRPLENDYRWLARVYASVQPVSGTALLWHRLGAKTAELIAAHLSDVNVDDTGLEEVVVDAGAIEALEQLGLDMDADIKVTPHTAAQVMLTLEQRLAAKLADGGGHPVYRSIAARLEELRRMKLAEASASVEFLKRLLAIARDLVEAERHEAEGTLDESVLPDPRIGALTQIFNEYKPSGTPVIVENVVNEVDEIVRQVRFTGWQTSQPGDREVRRQLRLVLNRHGLPATGELFDRAYAYISQNY